MPPCKTKCLNNITSKPSRSANNTFKRSCIPFAFLQRLCYHLWVYFLFKEVSWYSLKLYWNIKKNNSKTFQPKYYRMVLCIHKPVPAPPYHEAGGTAIPVSVKLYSYPIIVLIQKKACRPDLHVQHPPQEEINFCRYSEEPKERKKIRQFSRERRGPAIIFTFCRTKWKLENNYTEAWTLLRVSSCVWSAWLQFCLSLLFHIQEELLLLQDLSLRPRSLCKGWTTQPAAGDPSDGYIFMVSPTAMENDTVKHHPQPYIFQLHVAWLPWTELDGFHTEITPNTYKLNSPLPGTATRAKAQEERRWSIKQGKVPPQHIPLPGPPPFLQTQLLPDQPNRPKLAQLTSHQGSVRKCVLLLLDYMLGCSGMLCC